MSNSSSNNLPFVPENTIDPAAGLNLTIADLDIVLNISCLGFEDAPPSGVADGDRVIVGTGSGDFAGKDNHIAQYIDEGDFWRFIAPTEGLTALIDSSMYEYRSGEWTVITSEASVFDFSSDADATYDTLTPNSTLLGVGDTGFVTTGVTRTLTLPDVPLAPVFKVYNGLPYGGASIVVKGHGDEGPGVEIKAQNAKWVFNYGKLAGIPMLLSSTSRAEFMGGVNSLGGPERATVRTELDVYSKAEVDALIADHIANYHP